MNNITNDMIMKKAFDHKEKLNVLRYFYLKSVIKKLKKHDNNRGCFSNFDIFRILCIMISYYDVYLAKENYNIMGGVFVGVPYEDESITSISYIVNKKYRNQGIGSNLLQRTVKTCFEDYQCSKIMISHNVGNIPSEKIIKKCGFIFAEEKPILDHMSGLITQKLCYELSYNDYNRLEERFINVKKLIK